MAGFPSYLLYLGVPHEYVKYNIAFVKDVAVHSAPAPLVSSAVAYMVGCGTGPD